MSEELLGVGICSGSWWSSMRCSGIDVLQPTASSSAAAAGSDLVGSFEWAQAATEMVNGSAGRSFDDSPVSCITFQEQHSHNPQLSDDQMASMPFMDSVLSHFSVDWSQSIIDESCGGSLLPMFQEVSTSKPIHVRGYGEPLHDPSKDISRGFFIDPRIPEATVSGDIQLISSFGFQQEKPAGGEHRSSSWQDNKLQEILKTPPAASTQRVSNGSSWPLQLVRTSIKKKADFRNPAAVKSCNSEAARRSSDSSVLKKPRIETPSPLPAFMVRKEKLGDRVTALQQLVSPFGKTDTASVLYEAIEYIKFLHEQVRAQSSSYLRNGNTINHQRDSERMKGDESRKRDLRSRGLCLVPISSTFAVTAGEIPPEVGFWTAAFGGSYT